MNCGPAHVRRRVCVLWILCVWLLGVHSSFCRESRNALLKLDRLFCTTVRGEAHCTSGIHSYSQFLSFLSRASITRLSTRVLSSWREFRTSGALSLSRGALCTRVEAPPSPFVQGTHTPLLQIRSDIHGGVFAGQTAPCAGYTRLCFFA